jgi:fumarylacetoacetase
VVVSGTDIRRPNGQLKPLGADQPVFGPSNKMDVELELGAVVGTGNKMGTPITIAEADEMIFGYVLINDWSSRDIQAWEYQPLGPFQGKAFGTSIGAWIVTKDALEPFRTQLPPRDLPNLPYLEETKPGLYDINLKVDLTPKNASKPTTICQTNYNRMYYSLAQQLTHHAIGGCQMNTGDLLGSGTISGPKPSEFGSLLELSWNGERQIECTGGEARTFIEDYDRLTMTGWAQGEGYIIGFGECTGCILPAIKM